MRDHDFRNVDMVRELDPLYSIVLMLNPSVGLTVLMSSPMNRFTMVVLPALSSPLLEPARSAAYYRRTRTKDGSKAKPTASELASPFP